MRPLQCHIKWNGGKVWRARAQGYTEDVDDPENLAVQFTFPTGETWDCNLIEFNKRVSMETDILETSDIPFWVPKEGTQYEYRTQERP